MWTLLAFVLIVLFITVCTAKYHISPFLVLLIAAVLFGILTGEVATLSETILKGITGVFGLLCLPIFSGAVLARLLQQSGGIHRIVADLKRCSNNTVLISGITGYLLSIPMMCCISSFLVASPVTGHLSTHPENKKTDLFMTAQGAILSFVLIFPLPVTYAIVQDGLTGSFAPLGYNLLAVPLSLALLVLCYFIFRQRREEEAPDGTPISGLPRWKAWAPVYLPIVCLAAGHLIPGLFLLQNVGFALFTGMLISLVLLHEWWEVAVEKGTKHAGLILFDLCGAGALGAVIAAGSFAGDLMAILPQTLPPLLVIFLIAALIQAAQGSRVVTAVISASILGVSQYAPDLPIPALVLAIVAGTLALSYVSDPFFWFVKRATGANIHEMVKGYTLPQTCCAIVILVVACLLCV